MPIRAGTSRAFPVENIFDTTATKRKEAVSLLLTRLSSGTSGLIHKKLQLGGAHGIFTFEIQTMLILYM